MKNPFKFFIALWVLGMSFFSNAHAETIKNTDEPDKYTLDSGPISPSFVDYVDEHILKALDHVFQHDIALFNDNYSLPKRKIQHSFYFVYVNGKGYVLWSSVNNKLINGYKTANSRKRLYGLAHIKCLHTTRSIS